MTRDMDRYGEIALHNNGDCEWEIWNHNVRVLISQASDTKEEDGMSISYVPVHLDGVYFYDEAWAVSQEGRNDLLQAVQMVVEDEIRQEIRGEMEV